MKAKRAITAIASIEIEVFQLPNGDYVMSQSQVAIAVDLQGIYVLRFLDEKQPEALPGKDYWNYKIDTVKDSQGRGGNRQIKVVSLETASAFWLAQAFKGNEKAQALVFACTQESLKRRADIAFGVQETHEQYEKFATEARRDWVASRQNAKYYQSAFQNACIVAGFNPAQAHDMLTQAITGCTAKEHKMLDLVGNDDDIGLDHVSPTPVMAKIAYAKLMFARFRKGTLQERVNRAVSMTYKAGY
jgi:hypothetical protein